MEKEFADLKDKAESVHIAAMNLATTVGIFHGLNGAFRTHVLRGQSSYAVGSIQFDLLQIMAMRVCALCEPLQDRVRPDDASIAVIMHALEHEPLREYLIERDRKWRKKMEYRVVGYAEANGHIKSLKLRWAALQRHEKSITKLRHFRNKQLGHVTTGFDKSNMSLLRDLWRLADRSLSVAGHVRLVFHDQEWDYQDSANNMRDDAQAMMQILIEHVGERRPSIRKGIRRG